MRRRSNVSPPEFRILAEAPGAARALESGLVAASKGGLLLLTVTPLVVTPSTYFPFVVGKAVFTRSIIEVLVALWSLLALIAPTYRPRRSLVLVLLGAGLVWSVVSALMGASPQRSFWSNYERMQGVFDAAHWVALAMVVACLLRGPGQWQALLNGNLAVGLAVAVLTIFQYFGVPDVPYFGDVLRTEMRRPSSTLGNPIYLGAYLLLNAILAFGLLIRSCMPEQGGAAPRGARRSKQWTGRNGRRRGPSVSRALPVSNPFQVLWFGSCGALQLWGGVLATSRGPVLGAVFGLMVLAFVCVLLVRRRRWRLIGIGAFCAIAALGTAPILVNEFAPPGFMKSIDSKVVRRLIRIGFDDQTVQTRWAAWKTGLEGLGERPVLGWGPENFLVPFARYAEELPNGMKPHDSAHGALVEKFATEGVVGGTLYLGLWVVACIRLVRAARDGPWRDRVLVLVVGAALAAYFATVQTLFSTTVGAMQLAVLLGFVAGLEMQVRPAPDFDRPGRLRQAALLFTVSVFWCLASVGLWTNQAIYEGGAAYLRASVRPKTSFLARENYQRAIDAFEPLANLIRMNMFGEFSLRLYRKPDLIATTMPWLEEQAVAALAAEPQNWRLLVTIVQLYAAAAESDRAFVPLAQLHADRLLEVVPRKRGALKLYGQPGRIGPVKVAALPEGLLLDWMGRSDVITYQLAEKRRGSRWRTITESVASWAIVVPHSQGRVRYRVRGCFGRGNCGAWSRRVAIETAPASPMHEAAPTESSS